MKRRHTDAGFSSKNLFIKWTDSEFWQPRRKAVAVTIALIAMEMAVGTYIVSEYRALQVKAAGEIGSIYIDTLLAPYAMSQTNPLAGGDLDVETAFRHIANAQPHIVLRIWQPDGTLIFSSFGDLDAVHHDDEDISIALTGQFVSKLKTGGPLEPGFPLDVPFMEIYAPIHDPMSRQLIAVGELYQDATGLLRDRAVVELIVALGLTFASLCVLAMLALCFRQTGQLQLRLTEQRQMAEQNHRLRTTAERARLDAARTNEQMLNLIGAELHDGPVQLLGLMTLMDQAAGPTLPDGTSARSLLERVQTELRTMSAGLILPELEPLSTEEVVALAVERHHTLVGATVAADVGPLVPDIDLPRKICLYRVVQEAMMNAARHGDGHPAQLSVVQTGGVIDVRLRGRSRPRQVEDKPDARRKLGLRAMRRRLEAFGGRMTFSRDGDEAVLHITLPTA